MLVQDYLPNLTLRVSPESYAVVKAARPHPGALAAITDLDSVTSIVHHSQANQHEAWEVVPNWKICSIKTTISHFEPVRAIIAALKKINIICLGFFADAGYHLLIQSHDMSFALQHLSAAGCTLEVC